MKGSSILTSSFGEIGLPGIGCLGDSLLLRVSRRRSISALILSPDATVNLLDCRYFDSVRISGT